MNDCKRCFLRSTDAHLDGYAEKRVEAFRLDHLAEYLACMERLRKAQAEIAALLSDSERLGMLSDETMGDLDYACEWLEIALDRIRKEVSA